MDKRKQTETALSTGHFYLGLYKFAWKTAFLSFPLDLFSSCFDLRTFPAPFCSFFVAGLQQPPVKLFVVCRRTDEVHPPYTHTNFTFTFSFHRLPGVGLPKPP